MLKKVNKKKRNNFLIILGILLIIGLINVFTGNDTWINIALLLFLIFVYPIINLIRKRESLMPYVRELEIKMYGKPLDKNLWKKGELKNVKTKVVWKKKKKVEDVKDEI